MRNTFYSNSKSFEYQTILKAMLDIKNFCTATVQQLDSGTFVGSDGKTYKLYAPMYNWKEQFLRILRNSNLSSGSVVYEHLRGLNILASVEYLPQHVKSRLKEAWVTKDIPRVTSILKQRDEAALFSYIDRVLTGRLGSVTVGEVQNTVNKLLHDTLGLVYEFNLETELDISPAEVFKEQLAYLRDILTVRIKDKTFAGIVEAFKDRDAKALGALVVNCFHHPDFADRSLTSFLQEALNTISAGAKYIDCSDLKGVVFNKPKTEVFIEYYNNIHARAYPARLEEYQGEDGVYNYETGEYDTTYWSVSYAPKLRIHNAMGIRRGSRYILTKDVFVPSDTFVVGIDRADVLDEEGLPVSKSFTNLETGETTYYTEKVEKAQYFHVSVVKKDSNTHYVYYPSTYDGVEIVGPNGKSLQKTIDHLKVKTLLEALGEYDVDRMSNYRLMKTYFTLVNFIKKNTDDFLLGAFELDPRITWARAYEILSILDIIKIRSVARQFLKIYKEELIMFKREFNLQLAGLKPLQALELAYQTYASLQQPYSIVESYGDETYFEDMVEQNSEKEYITIVEKI